MANNLSITGAPPKRVVIRARYYDRAQTRTYLVLIAGSSRHMIIDEAGLFGRSAVQRGVADVLELYQLVWPMVQVERWAEVGNAATEVFEAAVSGESGQVHGREVVLAAD